MALLDRIFSTKGRGEIYRIWFDNDDSGKCYIGQTVQGVRARTRQHIKDAERNDGVGCPLLDDATRRFGVLHMHVETLETGLETHEELDAAEKFWIAQYDSRTPHGYNVKSGGQKKAGAQGRAATPTGMMGAYGEMAHGALHAVLVGMDIYNIVRGGGTSTRFNAVYGWLNFLRRER